MRGKLDIRALASHGAERASGVLVCSVAQNHRSNARTPHTFVVTVAAAVILIVVLFAAGPLRSSRHSPSVSASKSGRSGVPAQ